MLRATRTGSRSEMGLVNSWLMGFRWAMDLATSSDYKRVRPMATSSDYKRPKVIARVNNLVRPKGNGSGCKKRSGSGLATGLATGLDYRTLMATRWD